MFRKFGYFKEYYIGNKLIGFLICEKDRDVYGFFGRKIEKIDIDIILSNNKKIKKNQIVITMLFELCGSINDN
jgi:hypothetical protein